MSEEMQPISKQLKALRNRAELSMDAVAKALGFSHASAVQRYEDPNTFKKAYLPLDLTLRLLPLFVGRGDPPISKQEILSLAGPIASAVLPKGYSKRPPPPGAPRKSNKKVRLPQPLPPAGKIPMIPHPNQGSANEAVWVSAERTIFVIGSVEAGSWREQFELPRSDWRASLQYDGRYPGLRSFAAAVRGNAFAPRFRDGDTVIFLESDDVGLGKFSPGAVVIVLNSQGTLIEATLREYIGTVDGIPHVRRFSDPPNISEPTGSALKVHGLVVAAISYLNPTLVVP